LKGKGDVMSLFKGSGVAIVTPFNEDESVNFEKLGELIDWQIEESTDALIICGTTGEAATMDNSEQKESIRFAVEKVGGRIPVIAGTGSNNTKHAIEMSKFAESVGVDGILVVTPYYNKGTKNGLLKHYTAIADSVDIPIIVYNVPGRTGVNILPETVAELANHPNIQGVKEASGNISQVVEIARLVPDDFYIYSGNDDMIVPLLSVKGDGVISVVANIAPKDTHDMVMKFHSGDIKGACELQLKMKALIDALFKEVNPIPVKTALNLMGRGVGGFRLPLCQMSEGPLANLKEQMRLYGLL